MLYRASKIISVPVMRLLWRPQVDTEVGLAATARWYREQGWL